MFGFSSSLGKSIPENIRAMVEDPQSQTEALISHIYLHPNCPRHKLIDVKFAGMRIANFTARITNAREKLHQIGYDIECKQVGTAKVGKHVTKLTEYSLIYINDDLIPETVYP